MPYSLNRTSGPAVEPVTLAEAKKQLEIASADTTHDSAIEDYIIAAREQLEHDTGYICITQTYSLSMDVWPESPKSRFHGTVIELPLRPIQSVSSITYYDEGNSQQTLSTTVYGLDAPNRFIYLKYDQEWPAITPQHNGIVVTFVAGYGGSETNVVRLIRQAILLQVAKWFEHRGDESEMPAHDSAYEKIVMRMRSEYL